ncbi:MAG: histidine ammonia-lyase, partial [Flavobacteriaceae bacterium]|nr:histidine ammonia-lyase [Flavobacteriaceae bacterium]
MSRIENSNLSLKDIYFLLENPEEIKLNDSLKTKINQSFNRTQKMAKDPKPIYGINTGVGPLCTKKISPEDTKSLQRNLLLSHSVGVGNPISPELSRIMLLCK